MSPDTLLPDAVEVQFSGIEDALADAGHLSQRGRPSPALTATVVVVGPRERLAEAAQSLELMTDAGGVRTILISNSGEAVQGIRVSHQAIALEGINPGYVDNAVAALRLSSLPTMVWWRGGDPAHLDGLAGLADRLVLDAVDPAPAWAIVGSLAGETAVSDMRWTRLTLWRCMVANFFDTPEVREAAPTFTRLEIEGADIHAARLYAGWFMSSLRWHGEVVIVPRPAPACPIERVRFSNGDQDITIVRHGSRAEGTARVAGRSVSRTVSLGDEGVRTLISEELRIRSHDLPFEAALRASEGIR